MKRTALNVGGHSWGDSGVLCTARDLAKMILLQ